MVDITKPPPNEKAAIVNLFLQFTGGPTKDYPYQFWLKQVKNITFGDALEILKELETLPLKYNKAGTIINKLKKRNANRRK